MKLNYILLILILLLNTSNVYALELGQKNAITTTAMTTTSNNTNEYNDPHIPIVSTPVGFVRGAKWGTKAFAGAFGDEDGPVENLFGFIIGAPIGAVAGTFTGIFGGPFSTKEKSKN